MEDVVAELEPVVIGVPVTGSEAVRDDKLVEVPVVGNQAVRDEMVVELVVAGSGMVRDNRLAMEAEIKRSD